MSGVSSFLWRLVGVDLEEKRATEERFRRSLRDHEDVDANLDDILQNLQKINKQAKKTIDLNKTLMPFKVNGDTGSGAETG